MTRTGNDYSPEDVQRAVMFVAMDAPDPADPATYRYTQAARRLKAEYGIDVPESTLRRWVSAHPDYVGSVKVMLDLGAEEKLKEIIASTLEITAEALELLKTDPERLGKLSANDLKQIITIGAIAFDKKKILDAAKARDEHEAQGKLEFSGGPPELVEPPGSAVRPDGSPAPPVHKDQTNLTSNAGEA